MASYKLFQRVLQGRTKFFPQIFCIFSADLGDELKFQSFVHFPRTLWYSPLSLA